jgi:multidrug efflux pump subunit AcrB
VSAISEVRFVESKSRQGLSTVRVWMNWGADVNDGQTEVIQQIQQILNTLPRDIKQPFIVRYDLSNIPVALITGLRWPPRRAAALRSGLQHH